MKNLFEKIVSIYPELKIEDFFPGSGTIRLQNDSDGKGEYIAFWGHPVFSCPTKKQLDAQE